MVISENCCIFIVLNYKELQIIIAMITESNDTVSKSVSEMNQKRVDTCMPALKFVIYE